MYYPQKLRRVLIDLYLAILREPGSTRQELTEELGVGNVSHSVTQKRLLELEQLGLVKCYRYANTRSGRPPHSWFPKEPLGAKLCPLCDGGPTVDNCRYCLFGAQRFADGIRTGLTAPE